MQVLLEAAHGPSTLEAYQIHKIANTARRYLTDVYDTCCPFAVGTAALSLLRAAQLNNNIPLVESNFSFMTMDAIKTWDAMHGHRVGAKRHFFYDLVTTRWPWMSLLAFID